MTVGHYVPTPDDSPIAALRRQWWIPLILIPLCTLLGVGFGSTQSPKYTAQARLAVAANDSTAYTIAGFPLSAQALAADYARWVTNNAASGDVPTNGAAVSASPVPDSAVVLVEAESTNQDTAVASATTAASKLVEAVKEAKGQANPDTAYKSFASLSSEVAKAQAAYDQAYADLQSAVGAEAPAKQIRQLRDVRVQAGTALSLIQAKQQAAQDLYRRLYAQTPSTSNLTLVSKAQVVSNDRKSILQKMGLIGFGAGAVLSLILAALLDRRRRRAAIEPRTVSVNDAAARAATGHGATAAGPVDGQVAREDDLRS